MIKIYFREVAQKERSKKQYHNVLKNKAFRNYRENIELVYLRRKLTMKQVLGCSWIPCSKFFH